jgi:hypothetical protein
MAVPALDHRLGGARLPLGVKVVGEVLAGCRKTTV